MAKLNQILAVEKTIKGDAEKKLTAHYHALQKGVLLTGISRTHIKIDDAEADLPSESTLVQVKVENVLQDVATELTRLFDVTASKDWTNCIAKADVVVEGSVLLEKVPVTYLLFLERSLVNLETLIRKLPALDPGERWTYDEATDSWATPPARTTRTKKIPRNHVLAPASERHPAQVQVWQEDVVVGYWETVKYSGAIPAKRINELLSRVTTLAAAVKYAREEANNTFVDDPKPGKLVFDYLFH